MLSHCLPAQVDMKRAGMQALANKGLIDATFAVFVVRNPIDQYVAYLDELDILQPAFNRMLPEVLQYEGTQAAMEMLHLMTPPGAASPPGDSEPPSPACPSHKSTGGGVHPPTGKLCWSRGNRSITPVLESVL